MTILDAYNQFFLDRYHNYPQGRYTNILLVREIESEAIFRTEGSGESLNKEFVHAGRTPESGVVQRVVISKRKQTAVERRMGRDLLRQHSLLHNAKQEECRLNTNAPCERCMDCMVYGYAAGGGGAQRARVVTDDAFSLHPASVIVDTKQFNALYDNSTMRDEDGKASTSIGTDEYVRPESLFLDIETLRDLTRDEFLYAMGNILRSSRYGAISSRIGKVRNHVAGIIFSNSEIFSNLELTQGVYDYLRGEASELDFPLHASHAIWAVNEIADELARGLASPLNKLKPDETAALVAEITAVYQDENAIREVLGNASRLYPPLK